MKQHIVLLLLIATALSLNSCSEKTTEPAVTVKPNSGSPAFEYDFIAPGASVVHYKLDSSNMTESSAVYVHSQGYTHASNDGFLGSTPMGLQFDVPGDTTNTYSLQLTKDNIGIGFILKINGESYVPASNPGTLVITEYGPPGGYIKGTFSAKLIRIKDPTVVYEIRSGSFCIFRENDI